MTRFDPGLFPPPEAERFISHLFTDSKEPDENEAAEIREHIKSLYNRFITQGEAEWTKPLLDFLKEQPPR